LTIWYSAIGLLVKLNTEYQHTSVADPKILEDSPRPH